MVFAIQYRHILGIVAFMAAMCSLSLSAMEMDKTQLNRDLIEGVSWGEEEQVRTALEKGADANAVDRYGESALWQALHSNLAKPSPKIIDLLLQHGALAGEGRTQEAIETFAEAVELGNPVIVSVFLSRLSKTVIDVIMKATFLSDGTTILHRLVNFSFAEAEDVPEAIEIARLHIEAGANPAQQDQYEQTPAQWATQGEKTQLAAYLIEQEQRIYRQEQPIASFFDSLLSYIRK